ncbi:hypothetical protein LB505_010429 [Fusarium chuoi]|nr:hypothetical protein LB505_010429 [Fusarium chuoi]
MVSPSQHPHAGSRTVYLQSSLLTGDKKGAVNLGPKIFFFWGALCFLRALFAYLLIPEIKGLSLEQVDRMLMETSPHKIANWVPTTRFSQEIRHTE